MNLLLLGGLNAAFAVVIAVVAFHLDAGWTRDWWWFIAGMNFGLALTSLFNEWVIAKARRQVHDEMHKIGRDYVRQLREIHETQMSNPLLPLSRNDEPPSRLH